MTDETVSEYFEHTKDGSDNFRGNKVISFAENMHKARIEVSTIENVKDIDMGKLLAFMNRKPAINTTRLRYKSAPKNSIKKVGL